MKDATAELSTTVIAIVAIAAILAVFTVFLLPMLRAQIALTQACNSGPNYTTSNANGSVSCSAKTNGEFTCTYTYTDGDDGGSKTCTDD